MYILCWYMHVNMSAYVCVQDISRVHPVPNAGRRPSAAALGATWPGGHVRSLAPHGNVQVGVVLSQRPAWDVGGLFLTAIRSTEVGP